MRDRSPWPRLLAALLLFLWAAFGVAVLSAYHPGGSADLLVAVSAFLPSLVAAAGAVWPPRPGGQRGGVAVASLGVTAAIVLAPTLEVLLGDLAARDRLPLLPSAETGYAAFVALVLTCVYAGLGVAARIAAPGLATAGAPEEGASDRGRGRSLRSALSGVALGLMLAVVIGTAFGGAALGNERALRETPAGESEWGPVGPNLVPPSCGVIPAEAPHALVRVRAHIVIDGVRRGDATLNGVRNGRDERWEYESIAAWGDRRTAYVRIGERAWLRRGASEWQATAPIGRPDWDGQTLDGAVRGAISAADARSAAEDLGLDTVEGAPARHCRTHIDAATAFHATRALRGLVGEELWETQPSLDPWRGELDWWVFGDGQLGRARVSVGGLPGGDWPHSGLRGLLVAELDAVQRDVPQRIEPPVR